MLQKRLTYKQTYFLALLRMFPYVTPAWVGMIFFKGKGFTKLPTGKFAFKKGSAAAKLTYSLLKEDLIQTVWPLPTQQGYAITRTGKRRIEKEVELFGDPGSPPRSRAPFLWHFPDLRYRVLKPDKILYRFPITHVGSSLKFWYRYPEKQNLIYSDMITDVTTQFDLKSRPDWLVRKEKEDALESYCFEIEATRASKLRKYDKIKSLWRDKWKAVFFVFKTQADLEAYTTPNWNTFLDKKKDKDTPFLIFDTKRWARENCFFGLLDGDEFLNPFTKKRGTLKTLLPAILK